MTPRGVASPHFTTGRFSKSIPARLSRSYHEALADSRRLELDDELAVIISRNQELLNSLYSGESDGLWTRLRKEKRAAETARANAREASQRGDADSEVRYRAEATKHVNAVMRIIERGAEDAERWQELMRNVEGQRKLSESERKRRIEDQQIATVEEIGALMGALLSIITRHVKDERTRRAIDTEFDALISGAAPTGEISER